MIYLYSRALYRDLSRMLVRHGAVRPEAAERVLLACCEHTVERMARDHRRFARPGARLFREVRALFPVHLQLEVYEVIERHIAEAMEYLDQEVAERGGPDLLRCQATNRKGKGCQRVPVTGSKFCPSHRHLERLQTVGVAA